MSTPIRMLAVAACAAAVLTGCGASSKGGDTTCAEFNKLDSDGQHAAIKKMLEDQNGKSDPSNLEVEGTRLSASAFCKTLGKDSSKISQIDGS